MDVKAIARFWAKVNKNGPVPVHCPKLGPCWVWTAGTDSSGYGSFKLNRRTERAHALSYIMAYGPLPVDLPCTLHKCDNKLCARPSHLFAGTLADNTKDMDSKGRRRVVQGEQHDSAKLTDQLVLQARAEQAAGARYPDLAVKYGVSRPTIWKAVNHRTWKHV